MKQKYNSFILILFLLCRFLLHGQTDMKGTEFWLTFGMNGGQYIYKNLQIHIITGNQAAAGVIYFTHLNDSVSFSVAAESVFTHYLTFAQKRAAYNDIPGISNYSIHITSDHPINTYALNQELYFTDATYILPVNALGTDYYHFSYTSLTDAYAFIATQNNTQVYFNDTLGIILNKGEIYYHDVYFYPISCMTGDRILADKPIAFFTTSGGAYIPWGFNVMDGLFEQLPPVSSWGKNFFVPVSHRTRDFIRIVASQDGTTISQRGGIIQTVIGGQTSLVNLNAGQWVELEVSLDSNGCYIQADKPVGICAYLAGGGYNVDVMGDEDSDPAQAWLPAIEQRVCSAWVAPIVPCPSCSTAINAHYALVITPTQTKDSTTVKIGTGVEQTLSGGTWYDHASGYSFYNIPLVNDTLAYFFTNRVGGLIVMGYGTGAAESYYCLLASAMRNLEAIFYVNDIHYQEASSKVICEQPVHFHADINGEMSIEAGHLKWYIDNVEEIAARDQLSWSKNMAPGIYQIKMVVLYEDNIVTQTLETILTMVSLTVDVETTPEFCNKGDGTIMLTVDSEKPATIKYNWEELPDTTAIVTGLKSGIYKVMLSDTFCTIEETIVVEQINGPVAEFEANPFSAAYGEEIQFTDISVQGDGRITNWYWNFGDETDSYLQNPVHGYTINPGFIMVLLRIEDEFGCKDSIEHEILLWGNLDFPNVFTPVGGDGRRYVFRPFEEAGYFEEFTMEIYNRWGTPVWNKQCKAPNCPDYDDSFWWDGAIKSGKQVSDGVYYWVVYARYASSDIKPIMKNGSVTVFSK